MCVTPPVLCLQTLTLTFRDDQVTLTETPQRVVITMHADSLHVLLEGDESKTRRKSISTVTRPGDFTTWRDSRMAIGGLLGEMEVTITHHKGL